MSRGTLGLSSPGLSTRVRHPWSCDSEGRQCQPRASPHPSAASGAEPVAATWASQPRCCCIPVLFSPSRSTSRVVQRHNLTPQWPLGSLEAWGPRARSQVVEDTFISNAQGSVCVAVPRGRGQSGPPWRPLWPEVVLLSLEPWASQCIEWAARTLETTNRDGMAASVCRRAGLSLCDFCLSHGSNKYRRTWCCWGHLPAGFGDTGRRWPQVWMPQRDEHEPHRCHLWFCPLVARVGDLGRCQEEEALVQMICRKLARPSWACRLLRARSDPSPQTCPLLRANPSGHPVYSAPHLHRGFWIIRKSCPTHCMSG